MATDRKSSTARPRSAGLFPLAARLGRDRSGAVAMMFGIVFMVVMLITAVAIDYGRTELEWQRIQRAADAAALAASHRLGMADQDVSGPEIAERFFKANTEGRTYEVIESIRLDAEKGEVKVLAGGRVATSLLSALGIRSMDIKSSSRVVKGDGMVEIALVLDNSGSMAGQPIADLMMAAQNLVRVVFTGADQSERVKIGVVPFSGAVNVGASYRDASWMDGSGVSPVNGANFASNVPRFEMFDRLGVAWRGCVEARTSGLDVVDTPASSLQPESLFVPMFAPDEPDSENDGGASYSNSYLTDDGGACTPQPTVCLQYDRRGRCTKSQKEPIPAAEAQARICKYTGATLPSGEDGPNSNCSSQPILPLTSTVDEIEARLASMVARGSTNIAEGLMWGWRVLSPAEPFPEGRPYDTRGNEKVLVLMTDGANTYASSSNHNKSSYIAHGYGSSGRLGTTYTSTGYVSRMNQKTATACANAKAAGIKVYTVAFRLDTDPATQALLQGCATDASMAFRAADGAALVAAFEKIAGEISKLRVAG